MMAKLESFTNSEVQTYRERIEEFADPEARHCHSCQKYIPPKYKDDNNYLTCTCGQRTCYTCRKGAGSSCTCCATCRRPLSQCDCCKGCHRIKGSCTCTKTVHTNSSAVQQQLLSEFPAAKKCPNCPHAWEKISGCNHGKCLDIGRNASLLLKFNLVKCENCRHEFCWVCLATWKCTTHGYFS